jgi:hypothetical protein
VRFLLEVVDTVITVVGAGAPAFISPERTKRLPTAIRNACSIA